MIDRSYAKAAFDAYTSQYDPDNSMIRHKIDHTLRVAANCVQIADSLDLSTRFQSTDSLDLSTRFQSTDSLDLSTRFQITESPGLSTDFTDLAWFLGLLHDIGRFEQVRRYGTFIDSVSVDHAEFGADLLFQENLISRFTSQALPEEWLQLLETAIRLHNKLTLPEDLDERTRCFCDIIRDADKVDIFRVVAQMPFEQRIGSSKGLVKEGNEAGDAVMECVYQHRCVPRAIRENRFEGRIAHCCMAFELVYPKSRKIAAAQGFLMQLLSEKDENGHLLWNEKGRAQLRVLRNEIERFLEREGTI